VDTGVRCRLPRMTAGVDKPRRRLVAYAMNVLERSNVKAE
jgi:hypothetical protein